MKSLIGKLLVPASLIVMYMNLRGGGVKPFGIMFAIANMLCCALCVLAAVRNIMAMRSYNSEKPKHGDIFSAAL